MKFNAIIVQQCRWALRAPHIDHASPHHYHRAYRSEIIVLQFITCYSENEERAEQSLAIYANHEELNK